MKRKMIYSIGILLSIVIICMIIFSNESKSQQTKLKEAIMENEVDLEQPYGDAEAEEAAVIEEDIKEEPSPSEEEEETEANPLPERISEVIETTWSFFQSPFRIVAIGDSLTQGVGDSTEQGGYIGMLDRSINTEEEIVQFENYGKRGNRSIQLLKRLDEKEIQASIKKADMILITIGANDIMHVAKENIMDLQMDEFMEDREHYEQNLESIIKKIREMNEECEIFFVGFYNPFEKYFEDIEELDKIVNTYNGTTSNVANKNEKVTYIPTKDLFQDTDRDLLADDNFHPNYLGYHQIAKRVLDYITNEES